MRSINTETAAHITDLGKVSFSAAAADTTIDPCWVKEVIAITGTIGSGKSTVIRELKDLGACVVSADDLVRELYTPRHPFIGNLVELFGPDVVLPDGNVNRKLISENIFSNPAKKKALERKVHPVVHALAAERFSAAIAAGKSFLVYEVPLLFECGLEKLGFRKIVVVTADQEQCVKRIVQRSGGILSPEEARERIASQMPAGLKASKADVVIDNSGTRAELRARVEILAKSCSQSRHPQQRPTQL